MKRISGRDSRIELLRIFAMILIIQSHFLFMVIGKVRIQ